MSSDAPAWRAAGWIGTSLVMFAVLLMVTLLAASRLTIDLGIAQPEREHFAAIQAVLFGASIVVAVPLAGRLLGQVRSMWPGVAAVLPILLAAITNYLLVEDVRSGHFFETDHALPEIFVPMAIALLASADVGGGVAASAVGRRAWSWFGIAAALVLLTVVASTVAKAIAGLGDMFRLDSPLTFAALGTAAAYAVMAIGLALRYPTAVARTRGDARTRRG